MNAQVARLAMGLLVAGALSAAGRADAPPPSPAPPLSGPQGTAAVHRAIFQCYQHYLGRLPDRAGLDLYTRALLHEGRDEAWLQSVISNSPEHHQRLRARKLEKRRRILGVLAGVLALVALPFAVRSARRGWIRTASRWCLSVAVPVAAARVMPLAQGLFRRRRLVIALLFGAGVLFELHGSSIGMWDRYVRAKTPAYAYPSIGRSLALRADEWLLSTPWCIAQTQATPPFPSFNAHLYSSGMYMGLSTPNCPVLDITALGQFHNWGYFLFGAARGLAWNWWVRYLGILLLATEFFLLVAGRNRLLAVAGALSVTLASPTQWWDTTIPYHLLYFFGFPVAYWHFTRARTPARAAVCAALCVVFFCSFALSFYPPFQLPLAVMGLAVCGCLTAGAPRRPLLATRLGLAAAGTAAAALVLWRFAAHNWDGIQQLAHTVYPGARFFTGGDGSSWVNAVYPLLSLFFPFRDARFSNNCELSMFLTPLPALLIVAPWILRRVTPGLEKRVFTALFLAGVALLGWSLIPFPEWFARTSLLFMIHPNRAWVMGSFALQLAGISAISLMHLHRLSLRRAVAAVIAGAAALAFFEYASLDPHARGYFFPGGVGLAGLAMIAFGASLFGLLNYGLLRGRVGIFACALVLYALPAGLTVHPLSSGISPIMDKNLAVVCRRIQATQPSAKWIELGRSRILSQYLTALGLPVITGVHCIPDLDLWRPFDPDRQLEARYNRYAHVTASLGDDGPRLENPNTDHVHCVLRPEDLHLFPGLAFVLSPREVSAPNMELLEHLEQERLFIYRLKESRADAPRP